jgi:hypothetical protein
MVMDMKYVGRVVSRFAMAAGLAMALNGCTMSAEDPPRAMYGTTAWSDGWQRTCSDLDPTVEPKHPGAEHLNNDCAQYEVAQRMHNYQPEVAVNEER